MATSITMPVLGLTMEEGTVAQWLKAEGQRVEKDEPLLTVEMDKGIVEVPSPAAGTLLRIIVAEGQTVPIRTVIAELGEPGEKPSGVTAASVETTRGPAAVAAPRGAGNGAVAAVAAPVSVPSDPARRFASPRARMRARELGVDLASVRGTGPNGRIVEEDVLQAAAPAGASDGRVLATPLARRLALEHGLVLGALRGTGPGGRVTHEDVLAAAEQKLATGAPASGALAARGAAGPVEGVQPLSRVRRITAERMAASSRTVARVTLVLEADFTEAASFRRQLQPEMARLGVPKLPWDALIVRAAGMALVEHSHLMGEWVEGAGIRPRQEAHVGVAVALGKNGIDGLVVPVVRDADTRSLRDIAADILALADRARAGRLMPADFEGGTFTITNLGAYRIDAFTPIVVPGQAAILGVGRVAERPAVVDGALAIRTLCTLSLAFDHRVVDGAPAAAFLVRLAELLERPYALLGV